MKAQQGQGSGSGREKNEEKRLEIRFLEVLKRVGSLGVGAAFMTEDAVKNLLHDLPMPKDIMLGLIEQVKVQKKELASSFKSEFKNYLSSINPTKEIDKVLSKYEVNVNATFTFRRKKDGKEDKKKSGEEGQGQEVVRGGESGDGG